MNAYKIECNLELLIQCLSWSTYLLGCLRQHFKKSLVLVLYRKYIRKIARTTEFMRHNKNATLDQNVSFQIMLIYLFNNVRPNIIIIYIYKKIKAKIRK